jgi:outer membrane lipoprotein
MKKVIIAGMTLLLLFTGCTHVISESSLARADRSITFTQLQESPDNYRGKFLILGGSIAGITRTSDGLQLEVVQYPLDSSELPDATSKSYGRFMVILPPQQASQRLSPGMLVTVAGEVIGKTSRIAKEGEYVYPVLVIKELYVYVQPPREYYRGY